MDLSHAATLNPQQSITTKVSYHQLPSAILSLVLSAHNPPWAQSSQNQLLMSSCATRKEAVTFTSTPIPLNSTGDRDQHRCAPVKISRLAEAHTGSKIQSDIMCWYPSRYQCRMHAYMPVENPLGYLRMAQTPQRPPKVTRRPEGTWGT